MKKTLITLLAVTLVGAGCAMKSGDVTDNSSEPLVVSTKLEGDERQVDGEQYFVVSFSGAEEYDLTIADSMQILDYGSIDGELLHSESYSFGGTTTELKFVRDGDVLQVWRQWAIDESLGGPLTREAHLVHEVTLTPDTEVLFE